MHGKSKYGISRTIRVVLDLMTVKFLSSYSTRPLQMFGGLGLGMGMIGTPIVLYLRLASGSFAQQPIADRPLLLLGDLADPRRRAAGDDRPARGDAVAHLPRVAEQADLRDPRDPRVTASQGRSARAADPEITDIQKEFGAARSKRQRYADLVVGEAGWWPLVRYELVLLLSAWVPGALGLFLRSKLYPLILGRVGRNVAFGANVVLRHPRKIMIGDDVVIDDQCCLDAKGTTNSGIVLADGVFVGRNTILSCKNGDIVLEPEVNVGFNVEIFSAARVRVGARTLIAAYTYLVGGDHLYDRTDIPVLHQGRTAQRYRRRRELLARRPCRRDRRRARSAVTSSSAPARS